MFSDHFESVVELPKLIYNLSQLKFKIKMYKVFNIDNNFCISPKLQEQNFWQHFAKW